MLTDRHFPYSSMQEINLDWILTKVKNILRFVPDDGSVGQILRRTAHGAEWSNEQGGGGAVNSVNGQTGDVVLDASDVGALPDTTVIPTKTSDLNNDSGFVDAAGAAAAAPVQKVNGQTGTVTINKTSVGLGNVANVLQYSASNPPPYPVTSVNGQTGAVVISGGAVDSVNGQTGTVVLDNTDIGLGNVANVLQYSASNPPPYPVTSVNGQTGDVLVDASNVFGASVNLKTYSTFATRYIFPSDGYVHISAGNGTTYRARVFPGGATAEAQPYIDMWVSQMTSGNYVNASTLFVRKGMSVRSITGQDNNANTACLFFPLQ